MWKKNLTKFQRESIFLLSRTRETHLRIAVGFAAWPLKEGQKNNEEKQQFPAERDRREVRRRQGSRQLGHPVLEALVIQGLVGPRNRT